MAARKRTSELAHDGGDAPLSAQSEDDEIPRPPGKVRVTVRHGLVQADREYVAGESLDLHPTDAETLLALGILEPW